MTYNNKLQPLPLVPETYGFQYLVKQEKRWLSPYAK